VVALDIGSIVLMELLYAARAVPDVVAITAVVVLVFATAALRPERIADLHTPRENQS
jgi:hypothetical protein